MKPFSNIVRELPEGYSKVLFRKNVYGMSVSRFNEGKSMKVYAEELGGTDFISMNYYFGSKEVYFKPCEMPKEKVMTFFREMKMKS